jgi:hypothetical protein
MLLLVPVVQVMLVTLKREEMEQMVPILVFGQHHLFQQFGH